MKKLIFLLSSIAIIAVLAISCEKASLDESVLTADSSTEALKKPSGCTTIQSGDLVDSAGETIETGYNDFGYNYQAHMYNGDYGDPNVHLIMKWNDAWLSNKDCDGDFLLDRPYDENGNQYYFGSGAWLTNHWTETYTDANGNECVYNEFIKIIALPVDAELVSGYWYTADGVEIGPSIWNQFAIIQYIVNDPCGEYPYAGTPYKSPDHPGLGNL
jgi:hypothetical protein